MKTPIGLLWLLLDSAFCSAFSTKDKTMSNLKPFSNTYTPTYLLEKLYSQVDDIKYMAAIVVRKDGTYSLSCSDLTLKDAAFLKAILDEWMMASMRGEN